MSLDKELIDYFQSLGLSVYTTTKARGHQGFFLDKRIDISSRLPEHRIVPTLLHEFSHYIHSKLEKNIAKTGGTFKILFRTEEVFSEEVFNEELLKVTYFVDENSKCEKLIKHKHILKCKIKELDALIKRDYPDFKRSQKFKEFDKAIKGSKVKYLLKYDRVKIMPWLFSKGQIISIQTLETDFPNLKPAFVSYLKLRSLQRKQKRISNKMNKYKKYLLKPTELFARFIEGIYLDKQYTSTLAPTVVKRFEVLLKEKYYLELSTVFELVNS